MSKQHIKHIEALNFTIVAEPQEYHVNYKIYDVEAWFKGTGNDYNVPGWPRKGAHSHPDPVMTLEESEPYLTGAVKWDGCSNWHFDEQDRAMLHGCGRKGILRFGEVMALCWDWTAELCPHWDGT